MPPSAADRRFIDRREGLLRWWPVVGTLLMVLLVAMAVWLFLRVPLLANPFYVRAVLLDGTLDHHTLLLMAMLLPVVVMMLVLFAALALLLLFVAFANERRLIRAIRKLEADQVAAKP